MSIGANIQTCAVDDESLVHVADGTAVDNTVIDCSQTSSSRGLTSSRSVKNAQALEQEMAWFSKVLETRLALYFQNQCNYDSIAAIEPPQHMPSDSDYGELVNQYTMSFDERLILMLSIIPQLRPQILNLFLINDSSINRAFIEFGGWKGSTHNGFLPTGETAAFLIAGNNLAKRIDVFALLGDDHYFRREGILRLSSGSGMESYLAMPLVVSSEYFYRLTSGHRQKPDFSMNFPAKRIETNLDWDDLVLPEKVLDEINHIHIWLANKELILHGMGLHKSVKPGYRALFYGPPGTGKTLTASLLGKSAGMDVYRIDLSSVVSKYIGETEKNLEYIFNQAENRQWVLFFDEADALFGKRTQTQSSNDRHANQEVSYLLQRIETFPGVIILATNIKANIDEAFARRFQSMTYFSMPDKHDRKTLWRNAFNHSSFVDNSVDIDYLADQFELAGGAIINVVRFAAIASLKTGRSLITQDDIILGIAKELRKQGKVA